MKKCVVQIFCAINLIAVDCCVSENATCNRNYYLNRLFRRTADTCGNFLYSKESSVLSQFKFRGIDENSIFQLSEKSCKHSSKCLGDIMYIFQNIKSPWALKLFDSYGKPESGILHGNMKWLGKFNECIKVTSVNPNATFGNFKGKYCIASLSFNVTLTDIPLNILSAVCIPDSCSAAELEKPVLKLLNITGIFLSSDNKGSILNGFSLKCIPKEHQLSNAATIMIVVLVFFVALNLVGSSITAFKYFKNTIQVYRNASSVERNDEYNQRTRDRYDKSIKNENDVPSLQSSLSENKTEDLVDQLKSFFNCFCVFTNGSKILDTNTSADELRCIHGIRFLSMCWVMYGHSLSFVREQARNFLDLNDYTDSLLFQVVMQSTYPVDSFYLLSGFLLTYVVMKNFGKLNNYKGWLYFYIHRYIRLTPVYMIILGFYSTIFYSLGSGPFWPGQDKAKNCRDHWWHNLLYINNFDDRADECMGWTWYLATDMQFFIISPLFLIALWRRPKIGYSLIAIFMLICWFINFFITYRFELMAGIFNVSQYIESLRKLTIYYNKIHIKPYTRMSPYLIGMLTGYLLYKREKNNSSRHSLVFLCIGWVLSIVLGLASVFALYRQKPHLIGSAFYNAFHRTGYALSLAWIVYVCLIGQGGFVNRILSYKFFIPLSRLTFSVYLIHPMIIYGYFESLQTSIEFNSLICINLLLGFIVMSYALSLPVAVMLEAPFIATEKFIRKRFFQATKK